MSKRNFLPWLWALVVALLVAHNAYLWLDRRIVPDTDILALLPVQEQDPVLQRAFTQMVDTAQQRLIVLLGADDWQQASRAADAYEMVLGQRADLLQPLDRVTDQTETDWLQPFQQHRLVLLTSKQEAELRRQPEQYWIDLALGNAFSSFAGFRLSAWRDDPFGLFNSWVQARAQETPVRPRDRRLFLASAHRQYAVMPIALKVPAFSLVAQQAVMPLLEQAKEAAKKAVPQIEIVMAGVILHAAAASNQAAKELSTIASGSMVGVVLLAWLTFHSFTPIVLVVLSLGIGCIGAFSTCWLLFGRIHLLTLVFGATLIGVAQDYGIYFLCNRVSVAGMDSFQLLRRLLPGLALALVTTVVGYLTLALTPFPGLRQMAVFSGFGLLFAWLTVVFWFPHLVGTGGAKRLHWIEIYARSLARWPLFGPNRRSLFATASFLTIASIGLARLEIQDDVRVLNNSPKSLLDDQIKLSKLIDAPAPAQFYLVRGATAELVLQREEMLKQRLDPLVEKKTFTGYQAISNWVPSLEVQNLRRELIEQKLLTQKGPLLGLAARLGEDEQWSGQIRDRLRGSGTALKPEEFLNLRASEPLRHLWLGQVAGDYASLVALRGLTYAAIPALKNAATGLEGVQWVDKVAEISSALARYRKYISLLLLVSYVAVFAFLYPRYGAAAWRLLAPTAMASIFTLALMGIVGQKLQLFHVLALMLTLGIGVDYTIFLHERPARNWDGSWLAVSLSALSTLLSFGLLSFSKTPALQAFGFTMLIGTSTAWLLAPCFSGKQWPEEHPRDERYPMVNAVPNKALDL